MSASFAASLVDLVLACAWKSTLLLLAGAAAVALARRRAAAVRHRLWLAALLASLLVPLLHATLERPAFLERTWTRLASTKGEAAPPLPSWLPSSSQQAPATRSIEDHGLASPGVLLAAWLAGCAVAASGLLRSALRLRRWRRHASEADASWQAELVEASGHLARHRPARVMIVDGLGSPLVCGVLSHEIWIPREGGAWPASMRRSVLMHELAHAARHDVLVSLVARIACIAYWFQPLAWLAWRGMARERERACDDLVLAQGVPPAAYAEHLLRASTTSLAPAATVAAASRSHLEERILAVLAGERRPASARGSLAAATGIALALAVLGPAHASGPSLLAGALRPAAPQTFARPRGVLFETPGGRVAGVRSGPLPMYGWCTDEFSLVVQGGVEFTPDFRSLAGIGEGGYLLVERLVHGTFDRVEIAHEAGVTTFLCWARGAPVVVSADQAADRLAQFLPHALELTPIAIEQRVDVWLERGGPREALDRIAANSSSWVRAACLDVLSRRIHLAPDEARRALELTRGITESMVSRPAIVARLNATLHAPL